MNAITIPPQGIHHRSSHLLTMVILVVALLLPSILCSQSAEWMLFSPKTAGVPTAGIMRLVVAPDGRIWTASNDPQSLDCRTSTGAWGRCCG